MTIAELTEKIAKVAAQKGGLGKSLKIATDAGCVLVSADGKVSNDDLPADCTVSVKLSDLLDVMSGKLNPMTAMMFGKVKISGDMSVAMNLQSLL